jgi:hypothetical protein
MPDRDHLIFVNYRGSDEIWATEFVYARMTEAFGAETVFKAGNALNPGDEFPGILIAKAISCPVMLTCVGKGWLAARGPDGRRRLESRDDWVRREITASIRNGNRVIPLLLGDLDTVLVPKSADLPPELRTLFGRQAARLTPGGGLDLTVPRLIDKLAELVPELGARRAAARSGASATKPADPAGAGGAAEGPFARATVTGVGQIVVGDQIVQGPLTFNVNGLEGEDDDR